MNTLRTLLFVLLSLTMCAHVFAQATISPLLVNGPDADRIIIVMVAEAYPQEQLPKFLNDANAVLNRLMTSQPYKEYASYFNAYALSVASQDSGADHPHLGIYRNTFFNSSFDSYSTQRLVTIPRNDFDGNWMHGEGRVDSLLQILQPAYDLVLVIVNDGEYGGSGGSIAVISTHSSSPDIAVHELGHSFGFLGDEYSSAYSYPDIEEPNTTRETRRDSIKWRPWILDSTPIPTPDSAAYSSVIGLFEGAHYHATGWYRPKRNCTMRALGVPFCEVCREQLVRSVYRLVQPVDGWTPAGLTQALSDTESIQLSFTPQQPATHSLVFQWNIDGIPVPGERQQTYTVSGSAIGVGSHRVRADIMDSTTFVRKDVDGLLRDSVVWTVNVSHALAVRDPGTDGTPLQFALAQNFPNPFNPTTTIGYAVGGFRNQESGFREVRLAVYDILGREVAVLVNEKKAPGRYEVEFDASGLSSGTYFYRLEAGSFVETKKLVVVR